MAAAKGPAPDASVSGPKPFSQSNVAAATSPAAVAAPRTVVVEGSTGTDNLIHKNPNPVPVVRIPDCEVETMPSGEGIAQIQIPADVMRRLKTRAGTRSLNDFVWDEVIRPALYAATY
jgi:hypothetical protein